MKEKIHKLLFGLSIIGLFLYIGFLDNLNKMSRVQFAIYLIGALAICGIIFASGISSGLINGNLMKLRRIRLLFIIKNN